MQQVWARGERAFSLLECQGGRRRGCCSAGSAEEGAFTMMFANKKHFTTAVIGALIALSIIALVLSLVRIEDVTLPPTVKYGMVFDAGSSHTSLFIYEWDSDKENDTGVVSQTLCCDVQGQGISSYADDPPKAGDSLRECLDKALKVIPAAKHRDVPAYLGATAGMRLLREQNSSVADQVLAEVAKTMREYPVAFKGARILTGEEEGAYGWITINYLLESFTKYSPKTHTWVRPEAANIFGALDLGGASTQISFMPEGSGINWNEASNFMLYGYNYDIYTHSYLCYGQNEMLKRLAKELIAAFSAFYYNFKFLNLTEGQPLATVRETIKSFCTRSWEDLSSSYPEENPARLPKYCTNANYILTLLLDAYKFNETNWNNIFFQMKAGSANVGWTLGYMLNLTSMIPAEAPVWVKGHVPSLWAAAVAFIILTLALGLAALLLLLWV
ncbi:ectonucleoside triphosphate diphosphohydrolase 8-like isoform X3 [Cuculus canorus]|uniref:ectonucleoside triphosphate diphosphohydrolase 8-like isoform X3 n=1 Tax=Cuculus canorus TaxID=55661 RepID=UPI0023AAC134|nr:ectonucleoside triphosphate diphosphohydrolase 8-like isoform X3 [Cuculus canorus]